MTTHSSVEPEGLKTGLKRFKLESEQDMIIYPAHPPPHTSTRCKNPRATACTHQEDWRKAPHPVERRAQDHHQLAIILVLLPLSVGSKQSSERSNELILMSLQPRSVASTGANDMPCLPDANGDLVDIFQGVRPDPCIDMPLVDAGDGLVTEVVHQLRIPFGPHGGELSLQHPQLVTIPVAW